MQTTLTSRKKTITIGPGQPFTIIGERINPTGRKRLAAEMQAGHFERVVADAMAQVEAGAHMLDINAGIPMADEAAIMSAVVRLVQDTVDVPLAIDSSIVEVLQAGLEAYEGIALVNSVTGEEERLEKVLPLVKKFDAAVIGVANDERGISEDPQVRFEVARKIIQRAADHGIPPENVLIDPLVMPVGAVPLAGKTALQLVRRIQQELKVNTVCGASNISFGLPDRAGLNAAFIAMLIASGIPCAIANPLDPDIQRAILASNLLMGNDKDCLSWIRYRQAKIKTI